MRTAVATATAAATATATAAAVSSATPAPSAVRAAWTRELVANASRGRVTAARLDRLVAATDAGDELDRALLALGLSVRVLVPLVPCARALLSLGVSVRVLVPFVPCARPRG